MHDPATPATLLRGQLWAPWGPSIAQRYLTDEVVRLVARRTGRSVGFVGNAIAHSQDRSRYLLIYRLSCTDHAVVYEAVDRRLGRDVAVEIHQDVRQHAAQKKLFDSQSPGRSAIAESQVMSRLEHSNVVRLLDVGEHGSWLFSVIELCDEHLGNWTVSLGWQKILARVNEAANGLAYLHELGYAHGDIKPSNILIKNGAAKLADFGLERRRRVPRIAAGVALAAGLGFSLGAASYAGSGDGTVVARALGAMDPLSRAETAAIRGDAETSVAELNRALALASGMTSDELYARMTDAFSATLREFEERAKPRFGQNK